VNDATMSILFVVNKNTNERSNARHARDSRRRAVGVARAAPE